MKHTVEGRVDLGKVLLSDLLHLPRGLLWSYPLPCSLRDYLFCYESLRDELLKSAANIPNDCSRKIMYGAIFRCPGLR